MSEFAVRQAHLAGLRNERRWVPGNRFDLFIGRVREGGRKTLDQLLRSDERIVRAVLKRSEQLRELSDEELAIALEAVRTQLRLRGMQRATVIESFAVVREHAGRVLGMWHHHTQIRASLALLRGCIAEMATGEGKTLAATLASATAALAGIPVHVVTVNDYLAVRDGEEMTPLYVALGLTIGSIEHEMDREARKDSYGCDICYCSSKELTFDFLKDRLVLNGLENPRQLQAALLTHDTGWAQQLMLRGLHFAIVDEADSVLVDEARTPLIISGQENFGEREEKLLATAMEIAATYERGVHFTLDESQVLHFTPRGNAFLAEACNNLEGLWKSPFYREPLIKQALSALHVYRLDRDYIVDEEGALQIVDPYTGRVMPGRSWGQGLQQMIEMKEALELTKPRETDAEISYQNFFRKYHHLCGMTGTGAEVAGEMLDVFRLRSEAVPLLKASKRRYGSPEVYRTEERKWQRVAQLCQELVQVGQAVLIGTNSVESSEAISRVLHAHTIEHSVLNARQDKEEAEVVARAGRSGAVTVATSMAGRGTDIKLENAAREAGGLHVILTELYDAYRIDRQFAGRSARQGDPGAVSHVLSLEDRLVRKMAGRRLRALTDRAAFMPHWLGMRIQRSCQGKMERSCKRQRMHLLKVDTQRQRALAFAGDQK